MLTGPSGCVDTCGEQMRGRGQILGGCEEVTMVVYLTCPLAYPN